MLMSLKSDRLGGTLFRALFMVLSESCTSPAPCILTHRLTLLSVSLDDCGLCTNELAILVTMIAIYYHQNLTHELSR